MEIRNYLKLAPHSGRIPELDGLRAIAIILVLFRHFIVHYQTTYLDSGEQYSNIAILFFNFMNNGWLGVDLFFILSGFLITFHLTNQQSNKKKNIITKYFIKRALRIIPLYYAIIGLILFSYIPYYKPLLEVSAKEILIHFLFLQDYFGTNLLITTWSLATEEKFYILAPLFLLTLQKYPLHTRIKCLIVIFSVVLFVKQLILFFDDNLSYDAYFWSYRAPFHFAIVGVVIGIIVAMLSREKWNFNIEKKTLLWPSVLFVIILLLAADWNKVSWFWSSLFTTCIVTLFGCIMFIVVKRSGDNSLVLLRWKVLRYISKISYSIYLAHFTLLPSSDEIYSQVSNLFDATFINMSLYFLIYISLIILFSLILHYVVEKPFLILKDKI